MRQFLFLGFVFFVLNAKAQDLRYVNYLVDTLCSPNMAGRGYVDDGLNKAADFIASQFDSIGAAPLKEIRFQEFNHDVNTFADSQVVRINDHALVAGKDFLVNGYSPSLSSEFSVVQIDTTYIDRPEDIVLMGEAIYLLHPVSPHNRDGASKRAGLIRELAALVPVINPVEKLTWSVGTQLWNNPVIEIDRHLVDWQSAESAFVDVRNEFKSDFTSRNVIGMFQGTARSDRYVVFAAHYDHLGKMGDAIFPGANDNASGTAMLLDLAAHFASNPPKHNVLFIAFAGEEAGLEGSKFFVDNPLIPLDKISFLINLDLTGNGEDGITVVNGKMFEEDFHRLAEINSAHHFVPKIRARGSAANSDHYWFSKNGVPAFFIYTHGDRKAYHDIYDVPETLQFEGYEGLFGLVVEFIKGYE